MTQSSRLAVTPWKESAGTCECCGRTSKTVWGDVAAGPNTVAVYYLQWTVGSADHPPNLDLIVGPWGDESFAQHRVLVSLLFYPGPDGGHFTVIDASGRPADDRAMCGQGLPRTEVIGSPIADEVFAYVDAIWLNDPRVDDVKQLNH